MMGFRGRAHHLLVFRSRAGVPPRAPNSSYYDSTPSASRRRLGSRFHLALVARWGEAPYYTL